MLLQLLTLSCCVLVACIAQMNEGGGNVGNSGDIQGASKQGEGGEGPEGGNMALQDVRNPGEEAGGAVESNKAVYGDQPEQIRNQQATADGMVNANNEKVVNEESPFKTGPSPTGGPTGKGKNSTSSSQTSVIAGRAPNHQMTPQGEDARRVAGVDGPDGINDGIVEYTVNTGKVANEKAPSAGASKPSPFIPASDIHEGDVARTNNKYQYMEGNDGPFGGADIDSPLRRQVGPKTTKSGKAANGQFGGSDTGRKGIKTQSKKKTKGGASH